MDSPDSPGAATGSDVRDWPIVVTNRCAEACADAFGFGDRHRARDWLTDQIADRGLVVDELPGPVRGHRSPSGWFALLPGTCVLPLAEYRGAAEHWAATNCVPFPRSRPGDDPLTLRGAALMALVNLLPHAVEQFALRAGVPAGSAREVLSGLLAEDARAVSKPPRWSGTRDADFYVVAGIGDLYCLPCRSGPHPDKPYDATTCILRD